jgi:glycine hydroxymethyltransferase
MREKKMPSFVNNKPLREVDPELNKVIQLEVERQNRKLIMIPSESFAPAAVRESLGSILQNLYAEGYPPEESRVYPQEKILDVDNQLLNFRRYSDPRYYKGVEFVNIIEELARRRCAELFSNDLISADKIFVNVQPLSGAPANNAVYQALIEPGDVVLGMNLFHGGHLTHGSSVNRSGKLYTVYHYNVSLDTEKIDYDQVRALAQEKQPKIIISGYSSYPWSPDWKKFKEIADRVNAYLFADVSHISGLIAAGIIPSPVGYADVITFTTHKTLCGPRGACILSFDQQVSAKIDKAVFPGEQGGPHVQVFAGMATAFKLAKTEEFRHFQQQIVKNCLSLSQQLENRGIRIVYGGTDTHLINIDCKSVIGEVGTPLSGDIAARILDVAGIVVNANTIPGDKSAFRASGVRMGTPWLTQRGLDEKDMSNLADIIADILLAIEPYSIESGSKSLTRGKIDFNTLETAKIKVRKLSEKALDSNDYEKSGYPQFFFLDDFANREDERWVTFSISGDDLREVLNYSLVNDAEAIEINKTYGSSIYVNDKEFHCLLTKQGNSDAYLSVKAADAGSVACWLRDLSDGYIRFDQDLIKRIPGPFKVTEVEFEPKSPVAKVDEPNLKPYFIGISDKEKPGLPPHESFKWVEDDIDPALKRTMLFDWHQQNGGKLIPFAGWEMPVWYSSVVEEHQATRKFAGLFDVSHMGVYQAEGGDALPFLNCVCANDIGALSVGQSCYTHFLNPDSKVIDDLLVYRHEQEKYLVVVNASNDNKDWSWLNAVKSGEVLVDTEFPYARSYGRDVILRNLRDPQEKDEMRVDIALQGPLSKKILLELDFDAKDKKSIDTLKRTELCHVQWNGYDLIISRTGYTGERLAFEIFLHPEASVTLWEKLIEVGSPLGLKPCGLGARDSLRTEAGLPLYGHEMGGELNLGVGEAGFSNYVKVYKPWFIGRSAFMKQEQDRKSVVARFRFEQQRVRMAHLGDPVVNDRGKVIGVVTSCAIDSDEYLTGQAYIENQFAVEGTEIFIFQGAQELKDQNLSQLKPGDRAVLPTRAKVVSRFAKL